MAGYNGHSMSNNAVSAYLKGEMPLSKWTKAAIMEEIEGNIEDEGKIEMLKRLTVKELKEMFLNRTSWHHTSRMYNCTDFYSLNFRAIEAVAVERIQEVIASRKRIKRTQEEIEAEKQKKAERKAEKEAKIEKESLFKYQKKYKTLSGFMRSESVDLEELREIRKERIAEKREHLRKLWAEQGHERGLKNIDEDSYIEQYIK